MKYILAVLLIVVVALGVVAVMLPDPGSLVEETTSTSTSVPSTTTTINPQIGYAAVCLEIGGGDFDPIIGNLNTADKYGYPERHRDMEYDGKTWFMDGIAIGEAAHEDSPFVACGERDFMQVLFNEREDIIAAGGWGS